jgi:hypothetical protein
MVAARLLIARMPMTAPAGAAPGVRAQVATGAPRNDQAFGF